jgi:hypothetical protein
MWSPFPNCYSSNGPPLIPTEFSNLHVDLNQSSSTSTIPVSSISTTSPTSTCLVTSPSIYHLSTKPPRHLSISMSKKRFHPYTNSTYSKKFKLNENLSSSTSMVDDDSSHSQNVSFAAGVAGFNRPHRLNESVSMELSGFGSRPDNSFSLSFHQISSS